MIWILNLLAFRHTYAQIVFPTYMFQGRGCWYTWEDIIILCSSVSKFEVWNTTSMVKMHEFQKEFPETTVYINDGLYYLFEYEGARLRKFFLNGTKINEVVLPLAITVGHDVLRVVENRLYYLSTSKSPNSGLHIHNLTTLQEIKFMALNPDVNKANRWFLTNYGLYKVQTLQSSLDMNTRTRLNFYDLDGNLRLNATVPDCIQRVTSDSSAVSAFVSSSKYFVYVACANIITQLSISDGTTVIWLPCFQIFT
jgi:hypothetical protein